VGPISSHSQHHRSIPSTRRRGLVTGSSPELPNWNRGYMPQKTE
jgi:hypothetical protein